MSSSPPSASSIVQSRTPLLSLSAPQVAVVQIALFAIVFALLWPTTLSLMQEWADTDFATYTHGYLIAAVSVWLLYRNRDRLACVPLRPSALGCALLVLTGLTWLIVLRAGLQSLHQALLPILLWLTYLAALGRTVALRSVFAVGYLYFAIPLWGEINALLQGGTVVAVDILLRVSGVAAYVYGNMVHLAAGSFEIAGGCSGLHFFIVALAIATLYGEIHRDSLKVRLQLAALAIVAALLTNWLRVYAIIVAGYLTDMQHYLVRVEHYRFGWVVFAAMMIVFFVIARRMPSQDEDSRESVERTESVEGVGLSPVGLVAAIAALAVAPAWNVLAPLQASGAALGRAPTAIAGWRGPDAIGPGETVWQPVFIGADESRLVRYGAGERTVELFTATYDYQVQGRELVGYGNSLTGEQLQIVGRRAVQERRSPLTELVLSSEREGHSLLWYYYAIGERRTTNTLLAQIQYGLASLGGAAPSSVVAWRAKCQNDCVEARRALAEFAAAFDPEYADLSST